MAALEDCAFPPDFICCITQEVMRDPVIALDGHSYGKARAYAVLARIVMRGALQPHIHNQHERPRASYRFGLALKY